MNNRPEKRTAMGMEEGDSVRVKRLFPTPFLRNYDPFVLVDEFFVTPPAGFPSHPHRGFEAITYLFEGAFRHRDNLGNDSRVEVGGAQRFTAGCGIVHSEMPDTEELSHGIQLWVNLAKRDKGIAPDYQQVEKRDFPEESIAGGKVRTIVGPGSPLKIRTPTLYLDVQLAGGHEYEKKLPKGFHGFVYLLGGELLVATTVPLVSGEAVFLKTEGLFTTRTTTTSRFVLIAGQPHNEPIFQHGPYVD